MFFFCFNLLIYGWSQLEPVQYWFKTYRRNDPDNEKRDLWYFTQLQLQGTSNLLYLPDEMYKQLQNKQNIQYTSFDEVNTFKLVPKCNDLSKKISNWFIISSIQGLVLSYYYKITMDRQINQLGIKFNLNFTFSLKNDLFSLSDVKTNTKLFMLFDYESITTMAPYKLLKEKISDGPNIECEYELFKNDFDPPEKSIHKETPKIRLFSYVHLTLSGLDLAHAIAEVRSI